MESGGGDTVGGGVTCSDCNIGDHYDIGDNLVTGMVPVPQFTPKTVEEPLTSQYPKLKQLKEKDLDFSFFL